MNAKDRLLRILMSLSLIIAFNQLLLHFALGPIGVGLNILSKILLAVFCTLVILIDLRTRVFIIFKWNV